jgi:putative zinc finger protein
MNEHPDELLAEYVDGSLEADDRARVEAHLASCSICSEEVAVAGEVRTALTALPEVPVPLGTTQRVLGRVERRPRWSSPFAWRAAGLAAAAAAVVGVVVYLGNRSTVEEAPSVRSERALEPATDEAGAPVPAPAEGAFTSTVADDFPQYTESGINYTPETLTDATRRFATDAQAALNQGFPPTARAFYRGYDLRSLVEPAQKAVDCVNTGVPPDRSVVPFVIEAAEFEGRPAYLLAYLRGTDADTPYDRVQVVVVDRESCGVLHFARQTL